ncbi:hypothetical protein SEVIR_2G348900v4 [Setaria viridis]|uniref:Uncharacterized protein n=1 Tax=Setaria viridis TaxID=4556 RepID=A0A4V6DBR9_SETVI|nr:uncharacterized protein LOC117841987 [Setaria viridis]TKW35096.1 hypothetical protein SEVIR_2G348900v2 [Setaria viridis]
MGNCSCLERARVTAWDGDEDWVLPAERSGGARGVVSTENGGCGGMRVKIRMTKGQLRRLLETAGRGGASDEDVVAGIMSMGTVRVDVVAELRQAAAERHRPPKLETIQEDGVDE